MDLNIFYNRYKTLKKIGEGGLGTVFLAEDTWNGRKVALKLLNSSPTSISLKNLCQREFKLLQNLKHPGLPQVYDFFITEDKKFGYTMEFVPGEPFLAEKKVLDLKTFYHLAIRICQILDFIHSHKIVHCDLKPQNFLVLPAVKSKTESHSGIKLMDFGLASSQQREDKNVKGTMGYIAPEILKGEGFDHRADLYSLGVIFYQALTGKLPFDYADPALLRAAQLEQKPVSPLKHNSKIPAELSELILKLLEVNPDSRIPKISFIQQTLEKLSKSKPQETFFPDYLDSGKPVGLARPLRFFRQNLKDSQVNLCVISGEKGVGKSTLLGEMKFLAQAAGYLTVEIKAGQKKSSAENLLEPVKSIYNFLQEKYPQKLSQLDSEIKSGLRETFGSGKGKAARINSSHDLSFWISFLSKVSDLVPLTLLLDDLDSLEPEELRFLKTNPYQAVSGRFFVVATCTPQYLEEKSPVSIFLKRHIELEKARLVNLNRLNFKQTRKFVATKLPSEKTSPEFSIYLYQFSNGSPLYLREILKFLDHQHILRRTEGSWQVALDKLSRVPIPPNLRSWLSLSLSQYNPEILNILRKASVLEDNFELESFRFISNLDLEQIFETLYIFLKDQILLARKDSWGVKIKYRFANLALKQILYQQVPQKQNWHAKIGSFYEKKSYAQTSEGILALAYHFSRSQDYQKSFQYGQLAALNLAQKFAFAPALLHLENCLGLAQKFPAKEKTAKTAQILAQRAAVRKSMGELNLSLEDLNQILKLDLDSSLIRLKAETYKGLTDLYRLKNSPQEAIAYLNQSLKIYQELGDEVEIARNYNNLGNIYWMALDYPRSEEAFLKAVKIQEKQENPGDLATTLNNMGSLYLSQNQHQQALSFYHRSLELKRNLDNLEEKARTLNNIGVVNMALGKYRDAIVSLNESWELNKKTENKKEELFNLENLTESYYKTGNFFLALNYGEMGIVLAQEIDFRARLGRIQRLVGKTYLDLASYTKAQEFLKQAWKTATSIEDKELESWMLLDLSQFYLALNQPALAKDYLVQAYARLKELADPKSQIQAYLIETNLALQEKNYKKALAYIQQTGQLAQKNNFNEEKMALNLSWGFILLESRNFSELEKLLKEIEALFETGDFGYFQPEFYLLKGKLYLEQKNLEEALGFLNAAVEESLQLQRKELIWQSHFYSAQTHLAKNDYENSYLELEKAVAVLRDIATEISNLDFKKRYLNEPAKLELFTVMKKLAAVLIGKPDLIKSDKPAV